MILGAITARPSDSWPVLVTELRRAERPERLVAIADGQIQLADSRGTRQIPFGELRELQFPKNSHEKTASDFEVRLTDGSRVACQALVSEAGGYQLSLGRDTSIKLAAESVFAVRFGELTDDQSHDWDAMVESVVTGDVLIVRQNNGRLTKIEGIVQSLSETSVAFQLGQQKLDVALSKLAGIRFFASDKAEGDFAGIVSDVHGGRWMASSLRTTGDGLVIQLRCGQEVTLPVSMIRSIDFSSAGVTYLADVGFIRQTAERLFEFETPIAGLDRILGPRALRPLPTPGLVSGPVVEFLGAGEALVRVPKGFVGFSGYVELRPPGERFHPPALCGSSPSKTWYGNRGWPSLDARPNFRWISKMVNVCVWSLRRSAPCRPAVWCCGGKQNSPNSPEDIGMSQPADLPPPGHRSPNWLLVGPGAMLALCIGVGTGPWFELKDQRLAGQEAGLVSETGVDSDPSVVSPAVLAAQASRMQVMRFASQATVSIFGLDGGGGGSGVLISPDGYALTNYHVSSACGDHMRCGLNDGKLYDAVIVGIDATGDVSLIKLLGREDFPYAELADSETVRPGQWVFAAGNPFVLASNLQPSISLGLVSGTHRYQYPCGHPARVRRLSADRRRHQPWELWRSAVQSGGAGHWRQWALLVRETWACERGRGLCD